MFDRSGLRYTFEPMGEGEYQVRLRGQFVCFSNHKDPKGIDQVLEELGYASRGHFLRESIEESIKKLQEG